MSASGWEYYDDVNREGTSISFRALRIGRKRWRVEIARVGIYVRLGPVEFSAGPAWGDDEC